MEIDHLFARSTGRRRRPTPRAVRRRRRSERPPRARNRPRQPTPPDRHDREEAWRRMVERFGRSIEHGVREALARHRAPRRRDLVEDLVQETWCRLLADRGRRLAAFRGAHGERSLIAWLRQTAYRLTVDHVRASRAQKRSCHTVSGHRLDELEEERGRMGEIPLPIARLALADWRHELATASRGSACQRLEARVVDLTVRQGWTSREVAGSLGGRIAPGTVDRMVYRARRRLRSSGLPLPRRVGRACRASGASPGRRRRR